MFVPLFGHFLEEGNEVVEHGCLPDDLQSGDILCKGLLLNVFFNLLGQELHQVSLGKRLYGLYQIHITETAR